MTDNQLTKELSVFILASVLPKELEVGLIVFYQREIKLF